MPKPHLHPALRGVGHRKLPVCLHDIFNIGVPPKKSQFIPMSCRTKPTSILPPSMSREKKLFFLPPTRREKHRRPYLSKASPYKELIF